MKTSKATSLEKVLRSGEAVVRPVSGVSMLPMLDEHTDAVRLITPDREIEVGDVVMYKSSKNRYILHRVCKIDKNTLIIRGDNCVSFEYVLKRNIIALMDGYIKNGRYIPADDVSYREYVRKVLATGKPLIPDEWSYIILLYKAAITGGKAPPAPAGTDWKKVASLCERHKISSAVATVIPELNPPPPEDICLRFSESFNLSLKRTLLFDAERSKISSGLKREHIRFLPLKAIIIKELYPKQGMREFADNDILYDKTRQNDLVRIMTSLGYKVESLQGVHDVFYKEPIFNFEMHKALFSEDLPYADFFSDIFNRAVSDPNGERMSDEDFYLHFSAHYAKHHERAGSGLRPLGDLYLLQRYNNNNKTFNRRYVDESLEKLGLAEFERKMLSVCDSMFENGQVDDDILRQIIPLGVYGSRKISAINAIRKKGRFGYLLSRLFLPYRNMTALFPILKPLPFLLPVFWVIRIVKAIANSKKRALAKEELDIIAQKPTAYLADK